MRCHFLLQGTLPTQESNQGLLHCRQIIYWLSYQSALWVWRCRGHAWPQCCLLTVGYEVLKWKQIVLEKHGWMYILREFGRGETFFFFSATPWVMQDLRSSTKGWNCDPCNGRRVLTPGPPGESLEEELLIPLPTFLIWKAKYKDLRIKLQRFDICGEQDGYLHAQISAADRLAGGSFIGFRPSSKLLCRLENVAWCKEKKNGLRVCRWEATDQFSQEEYYSSKTPSG